MIFHENMELSRAECEFEPGSAVDPVGRIFRYQGRILRGIFPPYVDSTLQVLSLAEKNRWFELGLIHTWRTNYTMPEFPLILEHKRVPFVTLRAEWPAEALREAALCYLRVATALADAGLCLKDAHTWNVLFDATKPYVIDWGSIRPISELNWDFWYSEFRKYFLVPLVLFSLGQAKLARSLLREHIVGVGNYLLELPWTQVFPEQPYLIWQNRGRSSPRQVFESLADYVASLSMPRFEGEWVQYEQPRLNSLAELDKARPKDRIVHDLITVDPRSTVIDIGCNWGLHSEICARLGKQVVAVDIEETCVNELFCQTRRSRLNILVLYMDFLWPMGESGIVNSIPSAPDRLACDTALAMALVHHLVFKRHVSFEAIAYGISRFTKRRAIVEFVPADDYHVSLWSPERIPWYKLENFVTAMKRYFKNYTILSSDPAPRKIIVFEGKKSQGDT